MVRYKLRILNLLFRKYSVFREKKHQSLIYNRIISLYGTIPKWAESDFQSSLQIKIA